MKDIPVNTKEHKPADIIEKATNSIDIKKVLEKVSGRRFSAIKQVFSI